MGCDIFIKVFKVNVERWKISQFSEVLRGDQDESTENMSRLHLLLILQSFRIGWQQNTTVISQLFTVCRLPLQLLTGENSSCHDNSRNYHSGRTESSVKMLQLDGRTVFTGGHTPSLSDGWLGPDEEVIDKLTQFWPSDLYDNCLIDLFKIINIMKIIVIDEIDSFLEK